MIYIITPVFNRIKFTRAYLQALKQQTVSNFKVVIVDDGSTDGTAKMVETEFPDVILLKQQGDLWWAEATNIGVRYALKHGATGIMTLNDDTLPAADYIEQMLLSNSHNPTALLGAFAVDVADGKPLFGGENLNWKTGKFDAVLNENFANDYHGLHEVNVFPGRGLLIPVEVFDRIGFYDSKNFPQTVADLDFTVRAHQNGFKIFCNFDAKIKIYPDESGGIEFKKNRSLKNFYNHLFGMRGGGNLKWFTIFCFKNAPKKYLLQYWLNGMVRRIGGYLIMWIKESKTGA
ncbi:MAG: glycosyltransferase family 2 protein [Alphaproteobacteria bacterium]|nr:glycosyltransferase family 2 protein [Alphaproteobacteria bacterium]